MVFLKKHIFINIRVIIIPLKYIYLVDITKIR